jgi:hypothetical protein
VELLTGNVPLTVALWGVIYAADFLLTMLSAHLYRQGAKEHIVYEQGLELTPYYQKDVAQRRLLSPRFLLAFVLTGALLWLAGILFRSLPFFFELLLGGWFLAEAVVLSRHLRNLFFFFNLKFGGGVTGQLRYAMWFTYRVSAVEFLTYALLYLVCYLLFRRMFFLGGLLSTSAAALFHWLLSSRARRITPPSPPHTGAAA